MNYILVLMWLISISPLANSVSMRYIEVEIGNCGTIFQEVVAASDTVVSIICSRIPSCLGFGFGSSTEQIKKFSLLDEMFSPYDNGNQSCNVSDYAVGKSVFYASIGTVLYKEASCFSECSINVPTTSDPSSVLSTVNDSTSVSTSTDSTTTSVSTNDPLTLLTTTASASNANTSPEVLATTTSHNLTTLSATTTSLPTTILPTTTTTTTTTNPCIPPNTLNFSNYSISYASIPTSGTVQCPSGSVLTAVGISSTQQFVAGACVSLGVPNTTTLNSYSQASYCGKYQGLTYTTGGAATEIVTSSTPTHACSPLNNGWVFGLCSTDAKYLISPATTSPTPTPNGTLTTIPAKWMLCPQGSSSGLWAVTSVYPTIMGTIAMNCERIYLH